LSVAPVVKKTSFDEVVASYPIAVLDDITLSVLLVAVVVLVATGIEPVFKIAVPFQFVEYPDHDVNVSE
jgi:hypothetical protein